MPLEAKIQYLMNDHIKVVDSSFESEMWLSYERLI